MKTAVILINRGGGSAGGKDVGAKVGTALTAAGIEGKVELLDGAGVARRAQEAVRAGAPLVIAGGGDGTISAAAGAIAGSDTCLGVLPLGTLNHFARDLGIDFDLAKAAAIIGEGDERRVDVAEVNGRIFINNSAIGLYPVMVLDRESQQKRLGRSKRLAMLIASVRTLARFRHQRLSLTVNEEEKATLDTPLMCVSNNDDQVALPAAGQRTSIEDGELSVFILRKTGRLGLAGATLRALAGITRQDDMIRLDHVQRLRVTTHRAQLAVAIDGETEHLKCPLDYRIRPGALYVLAPLHQGGAETNAEASP